MSETITEPVGTEEQTTEEEPDTFPREYVEQLRAEAAENRTKAKETTDQMDTIRDALRAAVLKQGSDGILHEPLEWSDEYDGENGMPDVEKVKAAAEALAIDKPWLSRPHGDAGQGFRGEQSDSVSLADLLRSGA